MEHYSAIKSEILQLMTTWIDLEGIMLSETVTWRKINTMRFYAKVALKKTNMNKTKQKQNS